MENLWKTCGKLSPLPENPLTTPIALVSGFSNCPLTMPILKRERKKKNRISDLVASLLCAFSGITGFLPAIFGPLCAKTPILGRKSKPPLHSPFTIRNSLQQSMSWPMISMPRFQEPCQHRFFLANCPLCGIRIIPPRFQCRYSKIHADLQQPLYARTMPDSMPIEPTFSLYATFTPPTNGFWHGVCNRC